MRHTLFIILSVLAVIVQARERSVAEMRQAASEVLPRPALAKTADGRMVVPQIGVLQAGEGYTVMGYPGRGFAVVANDDAVEAILGYSAAAAYDSTNVSDGLKWWLESVEKVLAKAQGYTRTDLAKYNKTGVESVEPMIAAAWGQGEPYNLKCPKKYSGSGHQATGCVATAMAQIMKYRNWPETGDGDLVYNFPSHVFADFAATTYDWNNMLDIYAAGQYNKAQAQAVAELILHCGVAVNMSYDDNNSGAQAQYVPGAMREHFRYNRNVNYRNRSLHTDSEWMGSIYRELAAGRPILYTGQDSLMSYGHAFIFDGYDADGLVHVNWGWDGEHNGYFDINILNSGYMGLSFTDLQSMIVGIGKPDEQIDHSIEIGIQQDLTLYSTGKSRVYTLDTSELCVYCLNDYDLVGTLAMVMPTATGIRMLSSIETFKQDDPLWSFTYVVPQHEQYTVTIPVGLADGTYPFYLAFREEGSNEWQPLYTAEGKIGYFQLTIQTINKEKTYNVVGVYGNYTTGIESVAHDETATRPTTPPAFNMAGQAVGNDYRGLVVKDGHKVLQR